jgi:hypothetical protein
VVPSLSIVAPARPFLPHPSWMGRSCVPGAGRRTGRLGGAGPTDDRGGRIEGEANARRALVTAAAGTFPVPATVLSAAPVITRGLVNITVVDVLSGKEVDLQVPVAVAAKICDLDVNVPAAELEDAGRADCASDVDQQVTSTQTPGGNQRSAPAARSRRGASGGPPLPPAVAPPASRRPPANTSGAPIGGPGAPSGSSCIVADRPRPSPRGLPPATATRPAVRRRGAPGDPPPARRHPARLRRSSRTSRTRSAGVVRAVTWRMRHPAATSSRARSRSPWKASKPRWASQPSNSTAIRAPG